MCMYNRKQKERLDFDINDNNETFQTRKQSGDICCHGNKKRKIT